MEERARRHEVGEHLREPRLEREEVEGEGVERDDVRQHVAADLARDAARLDTSLEHREEVGLGPARRERCLAIEEHQLLHEEARELGSGLVHREDAAEDVLELTEEIEPLGQRLERERRHATHSILEHHRDEA